MNKNKIQEVGKNGDVIILKHLFTKSGYNQKRKPAVKREVVLTESIKLNHKIILKKEIRLPKGIKKIGSFEIDNVIQIVPDSPNSFFLDTISTVEKITFQKK